MSSSYLAAVIELAAKLALRDGVPMRDRIAESKRILSTPVQA
mgnify:CR=1 FL=1